MDSVSHDEVMPMVICLTGATVKPGREAEEQAVSEQLDAELRSSSGFISAKDYTADDGEIITVVRFETDDDLMRWRDDGQHGANQKFVGDYYESFWVQTGTVHREYVWRDGKRIAGHGSWPFGRTTA